LDARAALFMRKDIYNLEGTEGLFLEAVRGNVRRHAARSDFYARLLDSRGFDAQSIGSMADIARIPVIPATFFKYHEVLSVDRQDVSIHATSSGTQGQRSQVFLDDDSIKLGTRMVVNCFKYHKLISPIPTNYVMLGYEPWEGNEMGAVKTAMGVTRFAPALRRVFVLRHGADGYQPDWFGVLGALRRFGRQGFPVRFVGFPAFLYRLVQALNREGVQLRLNRRSAILLGGGWKQFSDEAIDKRELYRMAEETLGVPRERIRDFYSAVEHSVAYAECRNHHMHVPIWSRVIIRDLKTLEPLPYDTPGFLSFVTPLVTSAPLTGVLMNDLAVLREGGQCGCGISSPWFEVLGRAGVTRARNCAVSADELMGQGR
jgi:phenylacetate-coenzyme A ligase PaaK-like adenylate-forming protein